MRIFAAMISILVSLNVLAAEPAVSSKANYTEGKDYVVLASPLMPADPTKIEVVEAFAYPCHACFSFEPTLASWIKKQQPDVAFVKVHVSFRPEWRNYQRGYLTLASLNLKENVHLDIFSAIHVQKKQLTSAQAWADFLAIYGVDKQTVLSKYDSFGISTQMKQADARLKSFGVDSTPTLIVAGKYKVSNKLNSHDEVVNVAQFLVDKVRAERARP
ncbi:MAG: thiol:disulfide interchange protein DsbA/DsbL [Pseudomonadota bacterium]